VLERLDPPLNLMGMKSSAIRTRLRELRAALGVPAPTPGSRRNPDADPGACRQCPSIGEFEQGSRPCRLRSVWPT
jgi:hypothetical protein